MASRQSQKSVKKRKYEYFAYSFKSEKDISTVVHNLPVSITKSEIYVELKNLNYSIMSVTRLINKKKLPMPLIAIQLTKTEKSNKIYELKKLLNCIITMP